MDVCPLVLTKFHLVCSHWSQVAEVAFEFMPLWPEKLCFTLKQNQLCVKSSWPEHPEGIRSSLIWPGVGLYRCQEGFRMALVEWTTGRGTKGTFALSWITQSWLLLQELNACVGVVAMSGFQSPCSSPAAKVCLSPQLWLFLIVSARPQRPDTTPYRHPGDGTGGAQRRETVLHSKHWCRTDPGGGRLVTELWWVSAWGQFCLLSPGDSLPEVSIYTYCRAGYGVMNII